MIKFSIKIPIYEIRLYVIVGLEAKEALKHLPANLRKIAKDHFGDDLDCRGMFLSDPKKSEHAITALSVDHSTLQHEIGHVCRNIMNDIGWQYDADNDEPLAYLEDFVSQEIHKKLHNDARKTNRRR